MLNKEYCSLNFEFPLPKNSRQKSTLHFIEVTERKTVTGLKLKLVLISWGVKVLCLLLLWPRMLKTNMQFVGLALPCYTFG